jgi:hypothetical protein
MKFRLILLLLLPVFCQAQATLSLQIQQAISEEQTAIPVMVTLFDQPDVAALNTKFESEQTPVNQRPKLVLQEMERAASGQQGIIDFMDASQNTYSNLKQLKIINMLAFTAGFELIELLSNHPDVKSIEIDSPAFGLIEPIREEQTGARIENGHEPGLSVIGSPALWAMGYTGRGTMAYSVDTGVWPNHPAIKRQFKGNRYPLSETWLAYDLEFPGDKANSHGTHTDGTILGLDTLTNDTIGSAFNAYFIATDPVVGSAALVRPLSDYVYVYEWCLNPDGDINTSDDVPDAINNSWGRQPGEGAPLCYEDFANALLVLEAAGIANVSSAGNEGPEPFTMSVPHNINSNIVSAFTVGSVNGNSPLLTISNFSSRGPSLCGGEGSLLIKPEVSAPGQNVRSCVGQDGYDIYSGTSMACPHVVGAVLLLKEAFPYLPGKDLLEALYFTAIDLGEPGEDNTYGMGIINVLNAFNYLVDLGHIPVPPLQSDYDLVITEVLFPTAWATCDNSFSPIIEVKNSGVADINGFTISYFITGENAQTFEYTESLAPNQSVTITLPEYSTGISGFAEFIFRAEMNQAEVELDPINNQIISRFYIKNQVDVVFMETFEDDFDYGLWHLDNADNSKTWELFETAGLPNSEQSVRVNLYDYGPVANQEDLLVGPRIAVPQSGPLYLDFDLAYQLRNGPPIIHDTLEVWIATNCEFNQPVRIYQKAGLELSTWSTNTPQFIPQTAQQWRHEVLDISDFVGEEFIVITFKTINRKGNNVYIDNVVVYQDGNPLSVTETLNQTPDFKIFPNPTNDHLKIDFTENQNGVTALVHDISGRRLLMQQFTQAGSFFELNVASLSSGIYLLELKNDEWQKTVRFVKKN